MVTEGRLSSVDNRRCDTDEGRITGMSATKTTTRIYVGGLGATVTDDDIRKTFSSLGDLESIEIVRTKDRSFAYLDLVPASDNSLSKLFSTYNGCVWKGGRLRLEKAKEHYLIRLKREWAEDVKSEDDAPSNGVSATKEMGSPEKSKKGLDVEKPQLRFYFPKLRKVKAIPFGGSGKHKYSFQRVVVPPLPNHFCDCEEHSGRFNISKEKHLHDVETNSGGINDEELKMMTSVMEKLLERDKVSNRPSIRVEQGIVEENSSKSLDNLVVNEEVYPVPDEDNLVMNLVAGGNDEMALRGNWELETILAKKIVADRTSIDRSTTNVLKSQKGKNLSSNKKRTLPSTEDGDGNDFESVISERKRSSESHLSKSETKLECKKLKKPESHIEQSNTKPSWSQKSGWKNLVGEGGNNLFHVKDITPSDAGTRGDQPESDDTIVPFFEESKKKKKAKHKHVETRSVHSNELEGPADFLPSEPNEETRREQPESEDIIVPFLKESEIEKQDKHEDIETISEQSKESKGPVDSQLTKANEALNNSGRGASWLQKSSWTQLVGESTNNSFSISQILPGITFEKRELQAPAFVNTVNSAGSNQGKLVKSDQSESTRDGPKALEFANEDVRSAHDSSNMFALAKKDQIPNGVNKEHTPENNTQTVVGNKEILPPTVAREDRKTSSPLSSGNLATSETCSFMRNAASLKEWAKTKAALSGSSKKKVDEK